MSIKNLKEEDIIKDIDTFTMEELMIAMKYHEDYQDLKLWMELNEDHE